MVIQKVYFCFKQAILSLQFLFEEESPGNIGHPAS